MVLISSPDGILGTAFFEWVRHQNCGIGAFEQKL